ncbi:MAG: homoserine dehydrogenase, partial [Clostridia bacterium]|nr:homoserine dehydrogenase [Clostridia bacterium]
MAKIAIMGCGVVGSGVADILMEQSNKLSARFDKEVVLSKILDIRDMAGTPYAPYMTPDADSIINDNEIDIVVVTIGGLDFAYNMAKKSLLAGKHVVTSNKEVVAAYGKELTEIAFEKKVRFLYEASAGGGIPVIRPLNICLASNDIYEIHGILN